MALFWQKGNKEEKPTKAVAPKKSAAKAPKKAVEKKAETKAVAAKAPVKGEKGQVVFPRGAVLKRPRVTEKAGMLSEKGIYTFEVSVDANSYQIAKAIEEAYKVVPTKISIARIPSKAMIARGKRGKTVSGKKAYVYLKKGDTIEFI